MNRSNISLLFAATLVLAGCGGGGGGSSGGNATAPGSNSAAIAALANRMITTATSEECRTNDDCVPWSVPELVEVTVAETEKPIDLR